MNVEIIVAIIGLLGILYVAWRDRNSAGDSLVQDAMSMLDRLQARVDELEKKDKEREREVGILRAEITWYKHGVTVLIAQIRKIGYEPDWTPDKKKE